MLSCIVGGISQKTFCLCFRIRTGTFGSRTVNTVLAIVLQLPLSPVEHFPSLQPFSDSLISLRPPLLHSHFSSLLPPIFFSKLFPPFCTPPTSLKRDTHTAFLSKKPIPPYLFISHSSLSSLFSIVVGRSPL